MAMRMPVRSDGARYIDQVHQSSAKKISQRVGVIREYNFSHLRLRFMHPARRGMVADILLTIA